MRSWKTTLTGALVAILAGIAVGGVARAQTAIDVSTLGAAVALPYLTTTDGAGERITVQTITNGLMETAINLHLIWLSGDAGDAWASLDFNCPLTPLETTYLVYELQDDETARVTFECSDSGQMVPDADATNNVFVRYIPGKDGMLFAALECQLGSLGCPGGPNGPRTLYDNALLADATVLDFAQGYAFSVNAVHIQSGNMPLDGDRRYRFDGAEYAAFPASLTTSYIAPDDDITLELLAFTLDGKVNAGPGILVKLFGFAFDDDENITSGGVEFDCFVVADLTNPPNTGFGTNIRRDMGGHLVGHIEFFPTESAANDAHENNPVSGDSNGVRKRPAHGWVIQTMAAGGDFDDGNFPTSGGPGMGGNGAWSRQLVQGTNPLVPIGTDIPSLNAVP